MNEIKLTDMTSEELVMELSAAMSDIFEYGRHNGQLLAHRDDVRNEIIKRLNLK